VASLRMVGEFERMGDLSVHIAKIARLRTPEVAVPAELVPTIARMSAVAEVMVAKVGHIIADSDVAAAEELEQADEEMDRLRRSSFRELLGSDWKHGVEPAVDIALLGRYYERIADHAVSIAHQAHRDRRGRGLQHLLAAVDDEGAAAQDRQDGRDARRQ
jgi:phosphate transport system protein